VTAPAAIGTGTAVVTGGGSGIGAALVREIASHGMAVVVADVDGEAAAVVAKEIVAGGGRALDVEVDVTSAAAVEDLATAAEETFGSVQLLCTNAGVLSFGLLDGATIADWRWMAAVNVEGLLNCLHAFLPRLRAQAGWRHVMTTSSTHAFIPGGGGTALYSATKHAVLSITQALRIELEAEGIGVTALCPGQVATRILDAQRNRPERFGPIAAEPFGTGPLPGIAPEIVAQRAWTGIIDDAPITFALGPSDLRAQVEGWWRLTDAALATQDQRSTSP
jgi:NAD(P)-dependent dehydrogenase (short-subunit alcohol dehydrogenase family)